MVLVKVTFLSKFKSGSVPLISLATHERKKGPRFLHDVGLLRESGKCQTPAPVAVGLLATAI